MRYWLFKSEPFAYGFDNLQRDKTTPWSGVRNFQARNNMIEMKLGDLGFFYHSSIPEPAVVGIVAIVKEAYPDATALDKQSEYYDGRSKPDKPIWQNVNVKIVEPLKRIVTLAEMRADPRLVGMALLRRGQRLSVQPIMPHEWHIILELSKQESAIDPKTP